MKTVFDIGLHNGDDAAYYLHLGHRVIGVEANPLLAQQCSDRFRKEIEAGTMVVKNIGVLECPGTFTFHRNLKDNGWSSFQPDKTGKPGPWEEVPVECWTLARLIEEYGSAHFIKIDIEGVDLQAIATLSPDKAPNYISLEIGHEDPILERLIELGYTGFKLVDGESYRPAAPIFDHEIGWRLLRKAGRTLPFIRSAICALPQPLRMRSEWNPPGKHGQDRWKFGSYNSGPFGEEAAGQWMPPQQALKRFREIGNAYRRAGKEQLFWWDVHAKHQRAS